MTSNLKVLQVIPKLGYGGAETGCYDIAHYLPENNCESFIVTSGGELLKFVDKKKVKIIKLPVHSKNPLLIFINSISINWNYTYLIISQLCMLEVEHLLGLVGWQLKLQVESLSQLFMVLIILIISIKKFYNSVMVRSNLIIAGSNFIFSHIKENYTKYLDKKKKLLVIFRGINVDYFDPSTKVEKDEKKLLTKWEIEKDKKILLLTRKTYILERDKKFL